MIKAISKMTWGELAQMDPRKIALILPIGSLEQHGPHLPLGTDDIILDAVLNRITDKDFIVDGHENLPNVFCLPPIYYGNSHEHLSFPGTISISGQTLVHIIEDVIESVNSHGFRKLIIFNSHGGNTSYIEAYSQEWERKYGVKVYLISLWTDMYMEEKETAGFLSLAKTDIHAGERETSLLLYLDFAFVRQEKIDPSISCEFESDPTYSGWQTDELSALNGTLGFPEFADSEKGEVYFNYIVDRTMNLIERIAYS